MEKSINYYKGQAFKNFMELNRWKYEGLKEMLDWSSLFYSWDLPLLNRWYNVSIELYNDSAKLFEALESPLSFRAYRKASEFRDMWEVRYNQTITYLESVGR